MRQNESFNQHEIDTLLNAHSILKRKATSEDIVFLQKKLIEKANEAEEKKDLKTISYTELMLSCLDTADIYVSFEDNTKMTFTFSVITKHTDYQSEESVFINVER